MPANPTSASAYRETINSVWIRGFRSEIFLAAEARLNLGGKYLRFKG